jgi:hypothetical protein
VTRTLEVRARHKPQPGRFGRPRTLFFLVSRKTMWFSWMDNRTLFACQTLLTMVYALAFLAMRRMYRHLPGTESFALGFFCGFLGCLLAIVRGSLPNVAAVVVGQFLIFSAFALFYRGILLFFRSPRTTRLLWISCAVALVVLTYYSAVENQVVIRIVAVSLILFLARSLIAVELFRQAGHRFLVHVFAFLMAAYALFGAIRSIVTFLHGPPYDFMQTSRFQTPSLVVNLLFICVLGLFFLLMLSSELVAIVEAQSLYDHVSGALNRRGIDQRLALELVRAERNGSARSGPARHRPLQADKRHCGACGGACGGRRCVEAGCRGHLGSASLV